MDKQHLITAFVAAGDALLRSCWMHQLWSASVLHTSDGRVLEVISPGQPAAEGESVDFVEAHLKIGEREQVGAVLILPPPGSRGHAPADTFAAIGADAGSTEGRMAREVILRVTLSAREAPAATGAALFEVRPHVGTNPLNLLPQPEQLLEKYAQLPGRCGLRAAAGGWRGSPDPVQQVVAHAAEERARQKAERLLPGWKRQGEEQILFTLMFRSLGYRPCAQAFEALALRFPLATLEGSFALPPAQARAEVLACWFGAMGLLAQEPGAMAGHPAGEEYGEWWRIWERLRQKEGATTLDVAWKQGESRPWNAPERRMVGFFHHLQRNGEGGWLKQWLLFLYELDALQNQPQLKKSAMAKLEEMFETPSHEPWRHYTSFTDSSGTSLPTGAGVRLIGADRMIIVMANAVLPFFLAYARIRKDKALEKLLYRLFIVLPPEAPNRQTRFMEKRLFLLSAMPRTLRMQQGLLQIRQDFCTRFEQGCQNCGLPDLIGKE